MEKGRELLEQSQTKYSSLQIVSPIYVSFVDLTENDFQVKIKSGYIQSCTTQLCKIMGFVEFLQDDDIYETTGTVFFLIMYFNVFMFT